MPQVGNKKFPYTYPWWSYCYEHDEKSRSWQMKPATKIRKVMREFKEGTLHSGKKGPVVKNPKQAIAIAISESKRKKK